MSFFNYQKIAVRYKDRIVFDTISNIHKTAYDAPLEIYTDHGWSQFEIVPNNRFDQMIVLNNSKLGKDVILSSTHPIYAYDEKSDSFIKSQAHEVMLKDKRACLCGVPFNTSQFDRYITNDHKSYTDGFLVGLSYSGLLEKDDNCYTITFTNSSPKQYEILMNKLSSFTNLSVKYSLNEHDMRIYINNPEEVRYPNITDYNPINIEPMIYNKIVIKICNISDKPYLYDLHNNWVKLEDCILSRDTRYIEGVLDAVDLFLNSNSLNRYKYNEFTLLNFLETIDLMAVSMGYHTSIKYNTERCIDEIKVYKEPLGKYIKIDNTTFMDSNTAYDLYSIGVCKDGVKASSVILPNGMIIPFTEQ